MESASDLESSVIFNMLFFLSLCYGMVKLLDYLICLFISLGFLFMNLLFGWLGVFKFFLVFFLLLN